MKKLHLLLAILLFHLFSYAQYNFMSFGKIDKSQFAIKNFLGDSTSGAIILGEYTQYRSNECIDVLVDYHVRILITNEDGKEYSKIRIPVGQHQVFKYFKAATYNLENNEIITSSIDENAIKTQDNTTTSAYKSFTLPNVKVGSIIEYTYTTEAGSYFGFDYFYLQHELPSIRTDLVLSIPNVFDYNVYFQGFYEIKHHKVASTGDFCGNVYQRNMVCFRTDSLPGFKEEPYANNVDNYLTGVNIVFRTFTLPQIYRYYMAGTYKQFLKDLSLAENFGNRLKLLSFTKGIIKDLQIESLSKEQKIQKIYSFVQKNMHANTIEEMYLYYPLRDVFSKKIGNATEINFLLLALLKEANITAYAVLLPTRNSKIAYPSIPMFDNFNYVVVQIPNDSTGYRLLDASNKYLPTGELQENCINGQGLIVKQESVEWIPLLTNEKNERVEFYNATINFNNESPSIDGTVNQIYKNAQAGKKRKHIANAGSIENYTTQINENQSLIKLSNLQITNDTILELPLQIKSTFTSKKAIIINKKDIIINPFLFTDYGTTPFLNPNRNLPIDFIFPFDYTYISNIKIPENCIVKKNIESQTITDPNNKISYTITSTHNASNIQIKINMSCTDPFFLPSEYSNLQELFQLISEIENSKIILQNNNIK